MRDTLWLYIISNPVNEAVLLLVTWVVDELKVREKGDNRGFWVEIFQEASGVGPGASWCASLFGWAFKVLDIPRPPTPALVRSWISWAKSTGRIRKGGKRGYLCAKMYDEFRGHIGDLVKWGIVFADSVEGNTSPGEKGSQRNGDGAYRRTRLKGFWKFFISPDPDA